MSKNEKKTSYSKRTNLLSHINQQKNTNESVLQNTNNLPNVITLTTNNSNNQNNNSMFMNSSTQSNNQSEFSFLKDKNVQIVDCMGKLPSPRFGHSIVLVPPNKTILFGGAVGDTKNYVCSNETYILNLITKNWLKLECKTLFLSLR